MESSNIVFAILSVAGATVACSTHGDAATVEVLSHYYTVTASTILPSEGRVVKVIGDGIVLTFPESAAVDAVNALKSVQHLTTELWQAFDSRCHVQVKAGFGSVVSGPLGPAGEERFDIFGDALNRLFKLPSGEFVITPELAALVR